MQVSAQVPRTSTAPTYMGAGPTSVASCIRSAGLARSTGTDDLPPPTSHPHPIVHHAAASRRPAGRALEDERVRREDQLAHPRGGAALEPRAGIRPHAEQVPVVGLPAGERGSETQRSPRGRVVARAARHGEAIARIEPHPDLAREQVIFGVALPARGLEGERIAAMPGARRDHLGPGGEQPQRRASRARLDATRAINE